MRILFHGYATNFVPKETGRCYLSNFRCLKLFRYILSFLLFLFIGNALAAEEPSPRKTVLVLSSTGGGGHIVAANALETLLGNKYDFKVVTPINQLRIWGIPSGEQFYNMMLRNGWIRSMNFMVRHVVPSLFHSRAGKIEELITSYIERYEPELIISLIPFINYPATEAARKKEIPYLLITTDNNLSNWVYDMDKLKHPNFKVTIGADLPTTRNILRDKQIKDQCIETVGLPLRPSFIADKNRSQILNAFELPEEKPIVLIVMGGAGGSAAYEYAKRIGQTDFGAHLIVVAGRNEGLKKALERLNLHPSNSLTALGYTEQLADLMAISKVIITKPGPGTINEAMAMKLPILIDNTGISLFWERANVDMVLNYGVGERIRNYKQIKKLLMPYLFDVPKKESLGQLFTNVPPNQFHERIDGIIEELIRANAD